MEHARPVVIVSRCLGFDACRYDGAMLENPFLERLAKVATLKPVCPEVEIGLGTPRDPIRLVQDSGRIRLVQPATGRDLTETMTSWFERRRSWRPRVDGFVLKSRSPSCGLGDARIWAGVEDASPTLRRGPGMFAQAVRARYPGVAVEDERRLTSPRIREHFLGRIFVSADFRRVRARPTMKGLVGFHARHEMLLTAGSPARRRTLGRLAANRDRRPVREVLAAFEEELGRTMSRIPPIAAHVNVLLDGLGSLRNGLTVREKARFLDALQSYREGRVVLRVPVAVLEGLVLRSGASDIDPQSYWNPYPRGLVEGEDRGRG